MKQKPQFTNEQLANHAMVSKILEVIMDLGERVDALEKQRQSEDATRAGLANGLGRETEH